VSPGASRPRSFRIPFLLACAAAILYLGAASARDFWSPDEPDFAEHVREMGERGSYLLPYENGRPYSEKPILFYWAVAATTPFSGGDVKPLATRVPPALGSAFLVFGAAWLAGRRGGRIEALVAGAATAVAPIVFWQGQFLQIDAMFSAILLAAFLTQLLIEDDPEHAARWRWVLHLLLPLAVLTKGPLALVLVGLVAAWQAVSARSWNPILRLGPARGAAVFAVLVVPWYWAAARSGGREYAYDLIVNQNWNRFFNAFDHVQPWWFYVESVWGDFFPFTLPALAAAAVLWRAGLLGKASPRPELRFAAIAAACAFLFLSTSQAKQGKYLMVAYPFAAVLLAAGVARGDQAAREGKEGPLRLFRSLALLAAAVVFGGALAMSRVARSEVPEVAWLSPYVAVPLAVGALGTAAILFLRRREAAPAFLALAAAVGAGEAATAAAVFPAIDILKTGRPMYERMRPLVSHGEPLAYFGGTYHCYPILILRRKTEHFAAEKDLAAWVARTPGALVLVDQSLAKEFKDEMLKALPVLDRIPVGGDESLLLGRR
jgi:4-amino-4-deoxy-L-arabinose transferase-like glycosyltransferase